MSGDNGICENCKRKNAFFENRDGSHPEGQRTDCCDRWVCDDCIKWNKSGDGLWVCIVCESKYPDLTEMIEN